MKLPYVLLIALFVVMVGLGGFAAYKYHQRPYQVPYATLQKERDALLAKHAADASTIMNLYNANAIFASDRATICTQLRAAKLVQPLCSRVE